MAEPDDHGDDRECDLEPVLDRALEVMRHKATQLVQTTKTMLTKYNDDAIKLDGCVATDVRCHRRESGLNACGCLPAQVDHGGARAARDQLGQDAARQIPLRELHPRDHLLDRLARAPDRLRLLDASRPSLTWHGGRHARGLLGQRAWSGTCGRRGGRGGETQDESLRLDRWRCTSAGLVASLYLSIVPLRVRPAVNRGLCVFRSCTVLVPHTPHARGKRTTTHRLPSISLV